MPKNKIANYTYAVGKRKTSSARVRLYRGKGESTINGKPIESYFPGPINKSFWSKPFKVVGVSDEYYVSVKVVGGGLKGQLEATACGIAKALTKENKEFKKSLKKAGLLTRDTRIRERRKSGTGGKARRRKQSPKR